VGSRQTVRITVDVSDARAVGQWSGGKLILQPLDETPANALSLPLMVRSDGGNLPTLQRLNLSAARGTTELSGGPLVALSGAHFQLLGPVPVRSRQLQLAAESDEFPDAFNSDEATQTVLFELSEGHSGLLALATANTEFALYVGMDRDNDGLASVTEVLCVERGPSTEKRCALNQLPTGRYWIRVHNLLAQPLSLRLEYAALSIGNGHASGPARIADGESPKVRLSYDLGAASTGSVHLAALFSYAGFAAPQPFAAQALRITKQAAPSTAPLTVLTGETRSLLLPPNSTDERVFIDSAGGEVLQLASSTNTVQLSLLRAELLPAEAVVGATVPVSSGIVTTIGISTSGSTLTLPSGQSRYVLRLQNSAALPAAVTLSRAQSVAVAAAQTSIPPGIYFNPARPGHGLFLSRARDDLQVAWYTYDQAGTPTFYLAFVSDAFVGDLLKSPLSMPLNRYSWDGAAARGQSVGIATLTALGDQGLQWTWNLDQASGSEALQRLVENDCIDVGGRSLDLSGLWFNPQQPGYGASVLVRPGLEIHAVYLYDAQGLARWLWSDEGQSAATQSPLYHYQGFCPTCTYVPVTRTAAGTLSRIHGPDLSAVSAAVAPTGTWRIDGVFNGSLSGANWTSDGPLQMLTAPRICR
jgi:hypothetical protein